MKKFFKHLALFFIFFYGIWFSAITLYPVYFKGLDYVSWNYKFNEISDKNLDGATLIFGDSATEAAINPKLINTQEKIYNLAIPGGTPFDSYIYIKRLLKKGIKPKRVFIIFSLYNYVLDDGFIQQNLNYNFYSHDEISEAINWQKENSFLYRDLKQFNNLSVYFPFSLFLKADTKEEKARLSYLEYYLSKVRLSLIDYNRLKRFITQKESFPPSSVKKVENDLINTHGHVDYIEKTIEGFVYPPEVLTGEGFPLHPFTKYFLEKTLKLLKDAEITTGLGYSPIPEIYFKQCSEGFKNDFKRFHNEMSFKYGVGIEQELSWHPQEQYADQIHLNKDGVKIYTKNFEKNYFQ